ncbi:MAG: beta-propeller domain-containing protein [Clostridiales Family XIII bacterium]|jgi:uncharacterized secreted protein with C-terminal beta-propeller domain|nr:beta-propeller domain-containing protein [Clostridiales Family XIII bacterium]
MNEEKFKRALREAVETRSAELDFFADLTAGEQAQVYAEAAAPMDGGDAQQTPAPAPVPVTRQKKGSRTKRVYSIIAVACAALLLVTFVGLDPANLFAGRTSQLDSSSETGGTTQVTSSGTQAQPPKTEELKIVNAGNGYENLYDAVLGGNTSYDYSETSDVLNEAVIPSATLDSGSADSAESAADGLGSAGGTEDYTKTNNQTEGVEEADIVKTDGKYIYTLSSEELSIVEAKNGKPVKIASIPQEYLYDTTEEAIAAGNYSYNSYANFVKQPLIFEMFITGDRLVLLSAGMREADTLGDENKVGDVVIDSGLSDSGSAHKYYTRADIYDISNPAKPVKLNSLTQDGSYENARMIGDYLYLISYNYYYSYPSSEKDLASFVPLFQVNDVNSFIDPDDVYIIMDEAGEEPITCTTSYNSGYTVITGIDTRKDGSYVSQKAVYGFDGEIYASLENLYLTGASTEYGYDDGSGVYSKEYIDYSTRAGYRYEWFTAFAKLTLKDGKVTLVSSKRLEGYLHDQFSIDEYEGVLRVAMTRYSYTYRSPSALRDLAGYGGSSELVQSTAVYTLDEDLNLLGMVGDIAPDEEIYSCRFMGETAYVVTFRNTDPLFSIDLSDPASPVVMGALEIPGFSDYLHPYGEGLLLGVGHDVDEDSGWVKSVKLSMFDISDPFNVLEADTSIISDASYTQVSENHKSILVDAARGIIAFPADNAYYICSYDEEDGFSLVKKLSVDTDYKYNYSVYPTVEMRGIIIGDYFYVISPNTIVAFDMEDDWAQAGSAELSEGAWTPMQISRYGGYYVVE